MTQPYFSTLPKASFNGLEFPYDSIEIKGSSRHHIHEFPHSAGGDPEKMGRKLYTIRFRGYFHDLPGSDLAQAFRGLLPGRRDQLLDLFEREETKQLVVPNFGSIFAFCTEWTGRADLSESLSGERWELEFLEDDDNIIDVEGREIASMPQVVVLNDAFQSFWPYDEFKPSLIQQINDAITSVDGLIGEADAYSNLISAKLLAVADLCSRADRELEELQDPMNHRMLEALKALWSSASDLADNVTSSAGTLSVYRVPRVMAVNQISVQLFGTAEKSFDLLQMNAIDDAFAIPAGTEIKYMVAA